MGLLDGILGGALGSLLGGAPAAGNTPTQGQGGAGQSAGGLSPLLIQLALQLIQQNGGLPALLGKLRQSGLGAQADSWVSTGDNAPVSGQQLSQALGPDLLGQLGGALGMDQNQVSAGLAQALPSLVNQLTPEGRVPDDHHDVVTEGLQMLLRRGL